MAKIKLDTRIESDVVERLKAIESAQQISISDVIANALDALDRGTTTPEPDHRNLQNIEQRLSKSIEVFEKNTSDRMRQLEENVARLVDLLTPVARDTIIIEDRAQRTYNVATLLLSLGEFMILVGPNGKERFRLWEDRKYPLVHELKKRQDAIRGVTNEE